MVKLPAVLKFFLFLFIMQGVFAQSREELMQNVYPWCIVAFDSLERNYDDRIQMLKEIGFTKYAYDWRDKHLAETEKELRLAVDRDIEIIGLWLWLNAKRDSIGQLSEANETFFKIIEKIGLKSTFWVGLSPNFFTSLSDDESLQKAVGIIDFIYQKATAIGCRIALYNHSGWFADPFNQIKVIKALPQYDLQIVYNFHHAHEHIDKLPEITNAILPYLYAVNLNGMDISGPKILPIGSGGHEKQMINILRKMGYSGPWGIMGHVENADVEAILKHNLDGLFTMFEN